MTNLITKYPLDLTGNSSVNLVPNEVHTIPADTGRGFALNYGAFYTKSLVLTKVSDGSNLLPNIDYICLHLYQQASIISGEEVCAAVLIINDAIVGDVAATYQCVGGEFIYCVAIIQQLVEALQLDERTVAWGDVIGKLDEFPAAPHMHDVDDWYGFEYWIAALDRIEAAIKYGDSYDHELIKTRITTLRTELQGWIDEQNDVLEAHIVSQNNPHLVTKAQVNLGLVENYGVATQADAEAGTSNSLYMTPLRVAQAIASRAGALLKAHTDRIDNPHSVTKLQIGLGNVRNYDIATDSAAKAGVETTTYMTPYLTKLAITEQASGVMSTHVNNTNNPHNTTAAQVGLGSVANYGLATQAQAEVTTTGAAVNTAYMTPLRTLQMILVNVPTALTAHLSNVANPHNTTAAQVGLGSVANYGIASQAVAEAGTDNASYMTPLRTSQQLAAKLGNVSNYAIATQAQAEAGSINTVYMTPLRVAQYVAVRLGNVLNYGVATQTQVEITDAAAAVNTAYMTPLRTIQMIVTKAGALLAAHTGRTDNPHGVTAAQVGLGNVSNYAIASQAEAQAGAVNTTYMTPLRVAQHVDVRLGNVNNYGVATTAQAQAGTDNATYMTPLRTWEQVSARLGNVYNYPVASDVVATAGASQTTYLTPHGGTLLLNSRLGNVSNFPPATTAQAQSGSDNATYMTPLRTSQLVDARLGNVNNYGVATEAEAKALASNAVYMTPWSVYKALVQFTGFTNTSTILSQAWVHLTNTDNPHSVTKAQVGLGNVANYGVATNAQVTLSVVGNSALGDNASYLTPLRGFQMIANWFQSKQEAAGTVTAMAGEWTYLCNPAADGGFYKLYINWGGQTSTGGWTYYAGMVCFGNIAGRNNPNYGVMGDWDMTSMTLATPASGSSWAEGVPVIGVGSYGEICKVCMKPNGLYVYRNHNILNNGTMASNTAAGSIGVNFKLIRDEAYLSVSA